MSDNADDLIIIDANGNCVIAYDYILTQKEIDDYTFIVECVNAFGKVVREKTH